MKVLVTDEESLFYGLTLEVEKRVEVRYFAPCDSEYFREDQVEIVEE